MIVTFPKCSLEKGQACSTGHYPGIYPYPCSRNRHLQDHKSSAFVKKVRSRSTSDNLRFLLPSVLSSYLRQCSNHF